MKRLFLVFYPIFLMFTVTPAAADTMWTLSGATFSGGGSATGSFTLDAAGNVTAYDIVTDPTLIQIGLSTFFPLPGVTYTPELGSASTGFPALVFETVSFFNTTANVSLILSITPGIGLALPSLSPGSPPQSFVLQTFNINFPVSLETTTSIPVQGLDLLSGNIVGTFVPSAVPEPSTLLTLAAGLLALGARRARVRCAPTV